MCSQVLPNKDVKKKWKLVSLWLNLVCYHPKLSAWSSSQTYYSLMSLKWHFRRWSGLLKVHLDVLVTCYKQQSYLSLNIYE